MFIRIKSIGRDSRFKDSSISAFNVDGQSTSTNYWLVDNMGNDLYLFKIRKNIKKGE